MEQKNQVNAYGGLGANGLDFGDAALISEEQADKEIQEAFSSAAVPVKPLRLDDEDLEDKDENLIENLETIDELIKCPSKLQSDVVDPDDQAPFEITDDSGYLKVL